MITLLISLFGCSTCDTDIAVLSSEGTEESTLRRVRALTEGARFRCVANLQIDPRAPLGGDVWRDDPGWTVSMTSEEARYTRAPERLVCEAIAYENAPLAVAPEGLFADLEAFVETCSEGPRERFYIDQARACGSPGPTDAQRWVQDNVFVAYTEHTAPDVELRRLPSVSFTTSRPWWEVASTTTDTEQLWLGFAFDPSFTASIHTRSVDGSSSAFELPVLPVWQWAIAADESRITLLGPHDNEGSAWVAEIDRSTGDITPFQVAWPTDVFVLESPMIRLGDLLIAAQLEPVEAAGALALVPLPGGPAERVELPRPTSATYAAVDHLWADPTDPGAVLIDVIEQDYSQDGDVSGLRRGRRRLLRFDLASRTFTSLLESDPWVFDAPTYYLVGPLASGEFVIEVGVEGGALFGVLDLHTRELAVSSSRCDAYPSGGRFTLGDTVVLDQGTWERWSL